MKIHLHTVCWNESHMLKYFFRHYEDWIDKFFIHDDNSTDGSREILDAKKRVVRIPLQRKYLDSWVLSAQYIYNNSWKQSSNEADWVVIANIDEHLYHPHVKDYLYRCLNNGITAIPSLGYQMISRTFPDTDSVLHQSVLEGAPWVKMSKMQIFAPHKIKETNFRPGRHRADFLGEVIIPKRDEMLNLHFKYLGIEKTYHRHQLLAKKLGETDKKKGWGHRYHFDMDKLNQDFNNFYQARINIHDRDYNPDIHHSGHRWWRIDNKIKQKMIN
ncbi:hypothetical protein Xen7305DRAFT_00003920 [Xenococcus sp. PCC 7305]|uniref:glycosyltransferase family 2 protein n=1 Tax=Xenococcus sp. PCC 7305 TaxID=102125 RepID=UPI0002AC991C|nr:glycosyltransferase family 2 protein [Xenococcus sp. PCC 7305]ELS00691.1 hypothetical protein Xen7305DRAFT_00003920 [Xenococcus sp. PCC 7305]